MNPNRILRLKQCSHFLTSNVSDDDYICNLSPRMMDVARVELRETESRRTQALEQFRHLIRDHPRIRKCQTDSITLLRFLRVQKFNVMAALEKLENFLESLQSNSCWYRNLSLEDAQLNSLLSTGYICPLIQKDKLGRQIIMMGCKPFDLNIFTSTDVIRLAKLVFINSVYDEDTQVGGVVMIYDASYVTVGFLRIFSVSDLLNQLREIKKCSPIRIKHIHLINMPTIANFLLTLFTKALSKKLKSRLSIHSSLEEFLENYEDRDIFPKEYGGTIPITEMVEKVKESLRKNQEHILRLSDQYIEV